MRIAIIGGTGTLGKAISTKLLKEGHGVVVATRNTIPEIDLTNPESIKAFFVHQDPFDAVVCAAGDASFKTIQQADLQDWATTINSKLMGQINLVRIGLEHTTPNARFVLTGGMLAYKPAPGTVAVSTVNAALDGFVRAAALDLKDGKSISIVHPPLLAETAVSFGMRVGEGHGGYPEASKMAEVYNRALHSVDSGNSFFLENFTPDKTGKKESVDV